MKLQRVTKENYEQAMARFAELGRRYDNLSADHMREYQVWADLISCYEADARGYFAAVPAMTAQEAVAYAMETMGLRRRDIATHFGGESHLSTFLSGKGRIPRDRLAAISKALHVPVETLLRDPKPPKRAVVARAKVSRARTSTSSP